VAGSSDVGLLVRVLQPYGPWNMADLSPEGVASSKEADEAAEFWSSRYLGMSVKMPPEVLTDGESGPHYVAVRYLHKFDASSI
jgi:hypothetical protein